MRDLHNTIKRTMTLAPVVATADTNGAVVDGQGYDSVEHNWLVGITGDTLSGSVKLDLVIQHGDLADGTDMAAVTDKNMLIGPSADLTSGIFATLDDNAEDDVLHSIGYRGPKRYSRVRFDFTGTHTNGIEIAATADRGHPHITEPAAA